MEKIEHSEDMFFSKLNFKIKKNTIEQEIQEYPNTLNKNIHKIGWLSLTRAITYDIKAHTHPNAFEICYMVRGRAHWWVGGEKYEQKRGEIYLTQPGERHGSLNPLFYPCEIFWIQVSFPEDKALPFLSTKESKRMKEILSIVAPRVFAGHRSMMQSFKYILKEIREPRNDSELMVRTSLYHLLLQICRSRECVKEKHQKISVISPVISECKEWLIKNIHLNVSTQELAKRAGLSLSQFYERFNRELGLPPGEFIKKERVELAKTLLLETDKSITQIAFELGFSSSQYFSTVFKTYTFETPRHYRTKKRE